MAEQGFPGWRPIDDLNDGRPGGRSVLAWRMDRFEERKKKQKRNNCY